MSIGVNELPLHKESSHTMFRRFKQVQPHCYHCVCGERTWWVWPWSGWSGERCARAYQWFPVWWRYWWSFFHPLRTWPAMMRLRLSHWTPWCQCRRNERSMPISYGFDRVCSRASLCVLLCCFYPVYLFFYARKKMLILKNYINWLCYWDLNNFFWHRQTITHGEGRLYSHWRMHVKHIHTPLDIYELTHSIWKGKTICLEESRQMPLIIPRGPHQWDRKLLLLLWQFLKEQMRRGGENRT